MAWHCSDLLVTRRARSIRQSELHLHRTEQADCKPFDLFCALSLRWECSPMCFSKTDLNWQDPACLRRLSKLSSKRWMFKSQCQNYYFCVWSPFYPKQHKIAICSCTPSELLVLGRHLRLPRAKDQSSNSQPTCSTYVCRPRFSASACSTPDVFAITGQHAARCRLCQETLPVCLQRAICSSSSRVFKHTTNINHSDLASSSSESVL